MRVIAGRARGCGLVTPKGCHTRPTTDRLKENLFNLLQPYLADTLFLDLFAGSGAIGIEALSRGAKEAVFVERHSETAAFIRENLRKTRLSGCARVMTLTVDRAIKRLAQDGESFHIIFMDPPYESNGIAKTFSLLENVPLLAPSGILAAELPARSGVPASDAFCLFKEKIYGDKQFVLFRANGRDHP